jgi:CelD/BcsL family acetyltransferase involved in cellulose biosynthesis
VELHEIDPVRDERWVDFIERHGASSLFHTPQWLGALQATYEYEPVAFTDAPAGKPLQSGMLFCRIRSWMTGRKLASLPFSDHCDLLIDEPLRRNAMLASLSQLVGREWRYVEIRPVRPMTAPAGYAPSAQYVWHSIDLRPEPAEIFSRFHPSHTRRAIRKAERVGVSIDVGRSETLLREFYALHQETRRRHRMPVQPSCWFRNLETLLGDRLRVYMARIDGRAIASIMTIAHKRTLVYKYGCSDVRFKRSGATPALFWRAIRDAKANELLVFDLGRSDLDDPGLQAFKDHLGATQRRLEYYRYSTGTAQVWKARVASVVQGAARRFVPPALLTRAGARFYRHFA